MMGDAPSRERLRRGDGESLGVQVPADGMALESRGMDRPRDLATQETLGVDNIIFISSLADKLPGGSGRPRNRVGTHQVCASCMASSVWLETLRHDTWPVEASCSRRSAAMLWNRCGIKRQ